MSPETVITAVIEEYSNTFTHENLNEKNSHWESEYACEAVAALWTELTAVFKAKCLDPDDAQ